MPTCFCKVCYSRVQIPDEFLGKLVTCPVCQENFAAPEKAPPVPSALIWSKTEILLGMTAAAIGLLLLARGVGWLLIVAGGLLFVLGGYLALAGSRSHLYQSTNEQTAILLDEIRQLKEGSNHEHSGR